MFEIGYVRISTNHGIYMHNTPTGSSIIVVHVDNMVAVASNKVEIDKLKDELRKLFSLMDLGKLKWLLGITVTCECCAHTISLCQATYIESIQSAYIRMHILPTHH